MASRARGAQVLFVGTVRDAHGGRAVASIDYSAYEEMAEIALARIERELSDPASGRELRIVHRLGALAVGDSSILIAAASPHREAAFELCRLALERVKREAPIWKRERYVDGASLWREDEPLRRSGDLGS